MDNNKNILSYILLLSLLALVNTALNLPGVPADFSQDDDVISAISDDIANRFATEYVNFLKTGVETATLKRLSFQLGRAHSTKDIFTTNIADLGSIDQFFTCTTCRAVANVIGKTFRSSDGELNGPNAEADAKKALMGICKRLSIQTEEVCSGLFDLNWPILHYIVMNTNAEARSICGTLPISFCQVKQAEYNWSLSIDGSKGLLTEAKSKVPQRTDSDFTIVQLTDIHYDPEYAPGSLSECAEPLCCRVTSPEGVATGAKAGYWSDYRDCDSPLHLIQNAFDSVIAMHNKIDFIYQTGDIVPHNVWSTTKEGNKALLTEIHDLIEQKFKDVPVFPTVGNHEPHPTNVFGHENVPAEFNVNWLYEHLWTVWQRWLPLDTKDTILKGGYYTVSPLPGFRIIALNNNDCYIYNWWIFYDGSATSQPQLEWLHDTLLAAEKAGEYVHILAHIPAGSTDCWSVWAREFNRLIERFSDTISGIFGGHTHKDEMNLHYSAKGYPMAIYWNGGSLTSYSYKNPNYRSYEVEAITYQVVDHSTYIFNLTEANEYGEEALPVWFKEYQFSEFTDDLSPAGIDALLEEMTQKPDVLRKYWEYKMTSADPKLNAGCSDNCLMATICQMATAVHGETGRCKELKAKLKDTLANGATDAPSTPNATSPTEGPKPEETTTPKPPETTTPKDGGAGSIVASITVTVTLLHALQEFLV